MKKTLSLLLAVLLMLGCMTFTAAAEADTTLTGFAGGSGEAENPYLIATKAQLENLARIVNGDNSCADTYFQLTADIGTAEDPVTTVIGTEYSSFSGHFDGAGHTVTLNIGNCDVAGELKKLGVELDEPDLEMLIRDPGSAMVMLRRGMLVLPEDVTVDDVLAIIAQAPQDCSGMFGKLSAGGEIKNVTTAGSVNGGSNVGGVCGYNSGTVTNCINTGNVNGGGAGGVCGRNDYGTVTNCINTGNVNVSSDGTAGGVIGNNSGIVANCYNIGEVSGGRIIGGVCGYTYDAALTNCYNIGKVIGIYTAGGVCGQKHSGTVTNCYYDITASGCADNGIGTGLSTALMQAASGTSGALVDLLNNYITEHPDDTVGWNIWKNTNGRYPAFSKAGVSVTLTPSKEEINAGDPVTITVAAEGEQNCADIVLEYNDDVFEYTGASVSNVFVSDPVDNKLYILTENTADPINVLTFTSKDTLTADTTADFKITSAKFAESISAMTEDAKDAVEMTGTSVKVLATKYTVTFIDGTSESSVEYYSGEKIAAGDIPDAAPDTGYKFNGWKNVETVYTKEQLTNVSVTDDIIFTADYSLDVEVEINEDYVHGTEDDETSFTKIIVTGKLDGYTYGGKAMYLTAKNTETGVNTFAYIVPTTDELTDGKAVEYATGLVGAAAAAAVDISVTDKNDVNGTGVVDIADARAVFNCANKLVDLDNYMAVYIRADLNSDGTVNTDDAALVINAIKTAGTVNANA